MNKSSDVIIIGGGIIGCAAAYFLAEKGVRVTVLEKKEIGHGGSSRNGGGVRQSARDARELPLAMHSVKHFWPYLNEMLGEDVEYCQKGNLRLGMNDVHKKKLEGIVSAGLKNGLDLKMLNNNEIREINPFASPEVNCASWCPTDGHANPLKATLAFYKRAMELGVRFVVGEDVIQLTKKCGKICEVITSNGIYEADIVVLAAGYDSRKILRTVGIDVPMLPEFSEVMVTEAFPKMFDQMLGTAAADFYGHQSAHGSFVFGGQNGMELYDCDYKSPITHGITAPGIARSILRYFPCLEKAKVLRTWSGWIDISVDKVPVISAVDEVPGLVLACGFTGHGFGIAPVVGEIISQIVLREETTLPVDDFRYDRFRSKN